LEGVTIGANGSDVLGPRAVDRFEFADGSTLTYTDLVMRGFDIDGTEIDDFLSGTNVVDRFRGGLGNDRLEGGAGQDSYFFNVGDGTDTIVDTASAGAGNEVVFGPGITSADLRLDLAPDQSDPSLTDLLLHVGTNGDALQLDTFDRSNVLGPRTIETFRFSDGSTLTYAQLLARGFDMTGTTGDDHLEGTSVTDRMNGGAGSDELRAGAGSDTLEGGAGNDRLIGGQGNDTYRFGSGSGQDVITDTDGSLDRIEMAVGVSPSDVVATRDINDLVLRLNGGADQLTVSMYFLNPVFQVERIEFADGTVWDRAAIEDLITPVITGTAGPDLLSGENGNERLFGLEGDDQLSGLDGNDRLDGGTGADQLIGGTGDDTYVVDDAGDVVTELENEGTDTVQAAVTYQLSSNVEYLTLTGNTAINGLGNDLDNVLTGNGAANVLTGGLGNDTYVVSAGDTVVELAEEGTDTVQAGVSMTLGANVENLSLTGSASLIGTGNALDNILEADGSVSILAGGDGNDTYLIGPNGDDDILVETATGGIDTVIAAHDYRLPDHIENLTMLDPRVPDFGSFLLVPYGVSEHRVAGHGNELNNMLVGGRANNVLDGGLGADTLIGGEGDDTYVVDNIGDTVTEQANEGLDSVLSTVSHQLSINVEGLTLIGTAPIDGTGNALNNEIRGNSAANVLDGGTGNDSLMGFGGADTYLFGTGAGRDTVFDSGTADEIDTIQFDAAVTAGDLEVYRNGYNLELAIRDTTDELTLISFFDSPGYDQKQVRFTDGTVWNSAELSARALVGTVITGSSESETILGSDGHDLLIGSAGNDVVVGGRGKDTLYGDLTFQPSFGNQIIGDDTLTGGAGDDTLVDFRGTNLFDGGAGDDTLILGTGVDTVLFGLGSGVDQVTFDNNRNDIDVIEMAAGIAPGDVSLTWRSSSSADLLILSTGDTLTIQLSTDWFAVGPELTQAVVRFTDGTQWSLAWSSSNVGIPTATSSDDVLDASFPATLAGLNGDDTYVFGSSGVSGNYAVIEAPGEGIDTVQSLLDYVLDPQVEHLILVESSSSVLPNAERGTGNELDNLLIGNTGDNILDGGAGNDVLVGGIALELEGPPYVRGTGSDILLGGAGDDVLMEDAGNFSFIGGALFLNNTLDRRDSVPRVADDLFIGGSGNDTYILHSQQQTVVELENEGTDTVKSTVSYVLGEHLENLELIASPVVTDDEGNGIPQSLNGTGNELDNVLVGNLAGNRLRGEGGDDTLWGGVSTTSDEEEEVPENAGNDQLLGGEGHDTYLFNVGDGIDTIEDVAAVGEGNRIQFGVGIIQSDLAFMHDQAARTLTIQVGSSGADRLILTNFDPTNANGSLVVETLVFSDGSQASLAALLGSATNQTPTVANPIADQTVPEETLITLQIPANTFADPDADDTLTYHASLANGNALPTWLNFDATTRTFTGTPDDAQVGMLDLQVTATDTGDLSVSDGFTLTVTNVNEAPIVTAPLTDQMGAEDEPFLFTMPTGVFADADVVHGESLTYQATLADGSPLPSWLSFNPTTRTFSGTPIPGSVGMLQVAVTATDSGGLSVSDVLALAISGPLPQTLTGTDGDDVLTGGRGDDTLSGGTGNDTMDGGPGQDTYLFNLGDGEDTITDTSLAGDGNTLQFGMGITPNDLSLTLGSLLIRVGTNGDAVHLTPFDPTDALGPHAIETFRFADGAVLSYAQLLAMGFDLTGTAGDDSLTGTNVGDRINGLDGNDMIDAGGGDDLLDGGAGSDMLMGRAGNDIYVVDATGDIVTELADQGTDTVQTSLVAYTLDANVENLTLIGTGPSVGSGNALTNLLTGNSEANLLDGKGGADTMIGGAGDDLYVVDQVGDTVVELTGEGAVDSITSSVSYSLSPNVENLVLIGVAAINGTGNDGDNVLTGNSAANVLTGLTGNDTYVVSTGDTVVEAAHAGMDTVISGSTHTLAANVEQLILVGLSPINGTGNGLDNVLNGVLNLAGNILTGGAGHDTYVVGAGDTVVEASNQGTDRVESGATYTLGVNVENLTLTGTAAINGTGNGSANVLTGNSANNVLTASGGNDTLRGGLGSDTVNGGSGNDTYLFGRGEGQDLVQDSSGSADKIQYDSGINPLDLVISRQANNLRLSIHGSTDYVTVQNWYTSSSNRTETIQAGNGQTLLDTQVDQLLQAMVAFTQQTGLTWDQAIDQQPQQAQAVLAASWQ
jgi:Ca2+-binding RTX toxin-like protein